MQVLDAIMKIINDLFVMNGIPIGTSDMITGGMSGFFNGIWRVIEFFQKLFEMFQGAA